MRHICLMTEIRPNTRDAIIEAAFLVLADADIDHAVEMCIQGRVINNGETCVAAKRFVIVDSVYEEFRDKFIAQCRID